MSSPHVTDQGGRMEPVELQQADGLNERDDPGRSPSSHAMEIADKIRPHLAKLFEGVNDENGRPMRPSTIRGIALRMGKDLYEKHLENEAAKARADHSGSDEDVPGDACEDQSPT
jgi:hypothetical protein